MWHRNNLALALLVGLAPPDVEEEPFVDELQIVEVEGGQLAPPEGCGKAENDQCPIAARTMRPVQALDHLRHDLRRRGSFKLGW